MNFSMPPLGGTDQSAFPLASPLPHGGGLFLCETIPQQDSAERAFNKLTRTFAAQVEALKKYRTGGQQHVTVQHVTVNEGGQAIVGNVSHGGQGDGKK
ncbi:MAG: hypothetical protein EOS34_32705 [Mesorhizobium sp.]|nr:MAG: hypothetical protein EOS34_32705 [Mesorhizobium sp.]